MHLKRNKTPKTWPITRKGTKYVVVPSHNLHNGIPLLVVLREILQVGKTRKEIARILKNDSVKVNQKIIKDDRYGLSLNDTISLSSGENYRLIYSKGKKFKLEEIKQTDAGEKMSKITGKKILKGNKIQVSFLDGRTQILKTKDDAQIGDSALIDLTKNVIKKIIHVGKGSEIRVISGKHIGESGKVSNLGDGTAEIELADKKITLDVENFMVTK